MRPAPSLPPIAYDGWEYPNDWAQRLLEAYLDSLDPDVLAETYRDNLSECPYWARYRGDPEPWPEGAYGPGTCIFGCSQEPECVTMQPTEGWPAFKSWTVPGTSGVPWPEDLLRP